MISIIVAMDENQGIGYKGNLLTFLPGDLPRFKKITTGHTVIMGRKTFDSLPHGPLKNRENIVVSRNAKLSIPGVKVTHSLSEAINSTKSGNEIYIIGGGEIYNEAIKSAKRLYITNIKKEFTADTFFPKIGSDWILTESIEINDNPELLFSYNTYIKS